MNPFTKIHNVNVWGLHESSIASGYPMRTGQTPDHRYTNVMIESNRNKKLGQAPSGSGHDNYLKGIVVQFDWKISQTIFPQVERYHFIDIVSSQSKMHRIQEATIDSFNEHVDLIIKARFMELVKAYNMADNDGKKVLFPKLVYSVPMGFEMTARFTTNYLQLKTIYHQRKNHKLEEWRGFCEWVESLPYFKKLVLGN